jgi:hypothetical protein
MKGLYLYQLMFSTRRIYGLKALLPEGETLDFQPKLPREQKKRLRSGLYSVGVALQF